jgi:hypothetical protein
MAINIQVAEAEADAGRVLHCTIVDAMKMYMHDHMRSPKHIFLTSPQERLLKIYCDHEFGASFKMRDRKLVDGSGRCASFYLGMEVTFGSNEFRLEE